MNHGKIQITSSNPMYELPDHIIVTDRMKHINKHEKNYILIYTTGKVTIPLFKHLYVENDFENIVFVVKNFEMFYKDFFVFKDIDFEYVDFEIEDFKKLKYKEIQMDICKKFNKKKLIDEKSIQLAFCPDIFTSVKNSLINSNLYLSKAGPVNELYSLLMKGPILLNELDKCNIKDCESHLKSLLLFKLIEIKNGKIFLCNYY